MLPKLFMCKIGASLEKRNKCLRPDDVKEKNACRCKKGRKLGWLEGPVRPTFGNLRVKKFSLAVKPFTSRLRGTDASENFHIE